MTLYEKICEMWPQERARELYLPQDIARELSFLSLQEMAEFELFCPLKLPTKISYAAGSCGGASKKACYRCRFGFLSSETTKI